MGHAEESRTKERSAAESEALEPTQLPSGDPRQTFVRTGAPGDAPSSSGGDLTQRYAIHEELGRGGMGLVVGARDRRLGRTVALKVLHPQYARDEMVLRRFTVEAQVGAQLEHPNIVPVYGMEEDDGAPAFTMRLLAGRTLRGYLMECKAQIERGALDEDHALPERLERFLKVCDAVAYAHSRGVIHRDIKPANVMLGDHREVYLVDWGIAKVIADEAPSTDAPAPEVAPKPVEATTASPEATVVDAVTVDASGTTTRHGEMIGTPMYMAPEQATGQLELHGPASDQFGLGMVLHELISLAFPRDGGAMDQVFAACRGERASLSTTGSGKPTAPALLAIVERATAVRPHERYPSVEAFAADLRRFVRGDEVSVRPDSWTRRVWKRLSHRPGAVLVALLAVLVLASVGTSVSLFGTIESQRRAAEQASRLSALTSVVVGRSEEIDARFADARALVEGLGVATEELLAVRAASASATSASATPASAPSAPAISDPADEAGSSPSNEATSVAGRPSPPPARFGVAGRLVQGDGPPLRGLRPQARYGMDVTFEMPLYLYPPDVPFGAVAPTLEAAGALDARFRSVLLASLDPAAPSWSRARQDAAFDAGRTPLHVTYVGFENGLLLNYPGYLPFPEDYDPRRRPWYREARAHWGTHFGRPYPDASGSAILVPCNRAVRAPDGALLAVAGADMALDDLARVMRIDDAPGWARSSLVDGEGRQIIDTGQAGVRLGVGLHGDAPIEAPPIEAEIWRATRREGTGFVRQGDELVLFDRLEAIDWTFIVRMDASRALATPRR